MTKTYSEIEKQIEQFMFLSWVLVSFLFFSLRLPISNLAGLNLLLLGVLFSCGGRRLHPSLKKIVVLISVLCLPMYSLTVYSSPSYEDVFVALSYICACYSLTMLTDALTITVLNLYSDRIITLNEIIDSYDDEVVQSVSKKLNKITVKNPVWVINGKEYRIFQLAKLIEDSKKFSGVPTELRSRIRLLAEQLEVDLDNVLAEHEQTSVRVSIEDLMDVLPIIEEDENFIEFNSKDFE